MQFEIGEKRGERRATAQREGLFFRLFFFLLNPFCFSKREVGHKGESKVKDLWENEVQREEKKGRRERDRKAKRALGEKGREFRYRCYGRGGTSQ